MSVRALFVLALLAAPALFVTTLAQDEPPRSDSIMPRPSPRPGTIWTVMNTVEAVVRDNYATVRVIADIGNRGPDPEFPFQVRIPADAFVTGLTIVRDGKTYEARIEDRAVAREDYDAHKRQEQTGGLVEKTRGASVYSFLVNVAEFTNVRATLTYERYLAAEEGQHRLGLEAPVSGFGEDQGAAFDVLVRHTDGVSSAWGSAGQAQRDGDGWRIQHRVGPRSSDEATEFAVGYLLPATAEAGSLAVAVRDGVGYFAHRFRAPADQRELPLDLVLVLDVSGSMQGLKARQMQDAASQVVGLLRPEDRVHVVFFSSDSSSPWRGLRNATADQRRSAAEEIQAAVIAGGTNIEAGVRRGLAAFDGIDWAREEGRMPLLVFLTDGQPSAGETDKARLRAIARDANDHGVSVFALAFGRDADWSLVAGLARDGQGAALRVPEGEGAEVDLRAFMAALTTPVLRNVTIQYTGAFTAQQRSAPVLFAGSEMLMVGTFDPAIRELRATVRGLAPDGPRSYEVREPIAGADEAIILPRLVAYEEIRRLQDLIAAEGERAEWVQAIKTLALRWGFVTDHTSLIVLLEERPSRGCMDCFAMEASDAAMEPGMAGGAASGMPTPASAQSGRAFDQRSQLAEKAAGERGSAMATPGFEGILALAAVGVALLALRRRRP